TASQLPRPTPWRWMAIAAYSEHVGRKRQEPAKYDEINSLYPRIRRSAIRTPTVGSTGPRKSAGDEVAVVGFKDVQAGIEEIAFRHDDHVEAGGDFVTTKNLSNQSFSSISLDGAAKLARGGNAQSANAELIGQQEDRCVAAMDFDAAIVH